jgi:hypothetical protein
VVSEAESDPRLQSGERAGADIWKIVDRVPVKGKVVAVEVDEEMTRRRPPESAEVEPAVSRPATDEVPDPVASPQRRGCEVEPAAALPPW